MRSVYAGIRHFSDVSYTSLSLSYLYVGRKVIGASSKPTKTWPALRSWFSWSLASKTSHMLRQCDSSPCQSASIRLEAVAGASNLSTTARFPWMR
eukprot:scaffold60412_cov32-Tisochrysis_lutea.AAC.2